MAAEFGEATAGVVTAQTKSGSNALHGSLLGYRQSGWGQASDPDLFTLTSSGVSVPPEINNRTYKRNQFGGSIGGAIIKNRLFYFADYRGTRDTSGATLTLTVPTALVHSTCLGPAAAPGADCNLSEYGVALTEPTIYLPPIPSGGPCSRRIRSWILALCLTTAPHRVPIQLPSFSTDGLLAELLLPKPTYAGHRQQLPGNGRGAV